MNISYHLNVGCDFFNEIEQRMHSPGEIVMVIRRPGNKILLMTKAFYPNGVYRLPTGKMKANEKADSAFNREIKEETGFSIVKGRLLAEVGYTLHCDGSSTNYKSFIFITDVISDDPVPEDKDECITGFKEIKFDELMNAAQELKSLQSERWSDWGHFRAITHEVVYKLLEEDTGQE
ncbi:MAG: NUDIX hydrolase [Armatimonadota bacterium]